VIVLYYLSGFITVGGAEAAADAITVSIQVF
jgi:hypothetical protein